MGQSSDSSDYITTPCSKLLFFACSDSFASAQSENKVEPQETAKEVAQSVVEKQVNEQEVLRNINLFSSLYKL